MLGRYSSLSDSGHGVFNGVLMLNILLLVSADRYNSQHNFFDELYVCKGHYQFEFAYQKPRKIQI
jgi:hypothetical protein